MNSTSGQPGSIATVRIRGLGSINAGSDPLYVIDGVPVNNSSASIFDYAKGGMSPLSTINSNDIENITVIKDAGAAALYGSRAATGSSSSRPRAVVLGRRTTTSRPTGVAPIWLSTTALPSVLRSVTS